MAPMSNTLAHSQTRSLNANSKWRSMCIMALGRSRMVHPFLQVRRETSVPCLSCFVYHMDKVELRAYPKTPRGDARAGTSSARLFGTGTTERKEFDDVPQS